jgi:hypothetical protein
MLCNVVPQQSISLRVAAGTDFLGLVCRIGYLERRVDRVAGQTIRSFQGCQRAVILMAFKTYRDAAVFFRMTGGTFLLRVLADFGLKACCYSVMTELTTVFQVGRGRNGCQRLVRVIMTFKTLQDRFHGSMGRVMAAGTLGHDLSIVFSRRVVSMKDLVAFGTSHCLVSGTVIFKPVVMVGMTAGTVLQSERFHHNISID